MSDTLRPRLTHMGLLVRDLSVMEEFYRNVFSMLVTDRGRGKNFTRDIVFLTADAGEHHQVVLASGRRAGDPSTIFQISFKVDSIDSLRNMRAKALHHGAQEMRGMNHGNALSIYFNDPEDNLIEVYKSTPFYIPQPHGDPLDLDQSDEQIMRETEAACRSEPGFQLATEYAARNTEKLGL